MAVRDIIYYPDPVLTEPTEEVDATSEDTHALVQDLIDTMVSAGGVGLAAPQIGVSKRVCVFRDENEFHVLVNPKIHKAPGDRLTEEEGCLSFPGVSGPVQRYENVVVVSETPEGEEGETTYSGYLARVAQHEVDHLDGTLFIDRMSPLKRRLVMKKYRKIRKGMSR